VELTWEAIVTVAGAISVVGGAWLTVRKIAKNAEEEKKRHAAEILQIAKEEIAEKEKAIEAKLAALSTQIETLESSVDKDLQHMRETYNSEIRNLGQKIEDLRGELRSQHTQMVQLLTTMIENSKE
jgi:glycerol-3-phosphate dehydrogenase